MQVKEIYWIRNYFSGDDRRWLIKFQIYASDSEVQELREKEFKNIIEKLSNEK